MACTNAGTAVAVEIFVEEEVVTPMRIVLNSTRPAEYRTFPLGILEKDMRQTA